MSSLVAAVPPSADGEPGDGEENGLDDEMGPDEMGPVWQEWLQDTDSVEWSIATALRGVSFMLKSDQFIQTLVQNKFISRKQ